MSLVFTIGSNGSGQLGIGHREDVSVPKPASFDPQPTSPITKIAAGGNHTLLLTKSGELYWSGDPASGACGTSNSTDQEPVFRPFEASQDGGSRLGQVALIAATWEASLIVAKDNDGKQTKIFTVGIGMKGELGVGDFVVRTPTATQINDFPPHETEIVDIHASMGHAVAVLSNGEAYGWGNCRKGQAGEPAEVLLKPRKIDGLEFPVSRAVCSKESTCFFGDPGSGKIKVLGSDKWALHSTAPQSAPTWQDVGASWGNFYILTKQGALTAWGRDDHGQLPPPGLPPLTSIAIGSEHAVALSRAGDVLAWGWGEHGNCGPQVENNNVKGRWNVIAASKLIPQGYSINAIGAGCATSWICLTEG